MAVEEDGLANSSHSHRQNHWPLFVLLFAGSLEAEADMAD